MRAMESQRLKEIEWWVGKRRRPKTRKKKRDREGERGGGRGRGKKRGRKRRQVGTEEHKEEEMDEGEEVEKDREPNANTFLVFSRKRLSQGSGIMHCTNTKRRRKKIA